MQAAGEEGEREMSDDKDREIERLTQMYVVLLKAYAALNRKISTGQYQGAADTPDSDTKLAGTRGDPLEAKKQGIPQNG